MWWKERSPCARLKSQSVNDPVSHTWSRRLKSKASHSKSLNARRREMHLAKKQPTPLRPLPRSKGSTATSGLGWTTMATISRSRPTTPIRRVSRGSIARASISNASSSSTPLSFLTQAMSDLSYETSTLHSNLECIEEINQALLTFDESFSMFLYGLRMNAFCVEWPEVSSRHREGLGSLSCYLMTGAW